MKEAIKGFEDIIDSYEIISDAENDGVLFSHAIVVFKDCSKLDAKDRFLKTLKKRKYSFQWMKADDSLIIRWDNAGHHPQIPSFPHHKHIHHEQNVQPSVEPTFKSVLTEIKKWLKG